MFRNYYPWSNFDLHSWNCGAEVLSENPIILEQIAEVLSEIYLSPELVIQPGGNEHQITKNIMTAFRHRGFQMQPVFPEINHKIDMVKSPVVIEVEWNSKGIALARDLGAFRVLFESGIITCGVIVTRSSSLQPILAKIMRSRNLPNKYDGMTTHMHQLMNKIDMLGKCPLLAIGISEHQMFYDDAEETVSEIFSFPSSLRICRVQEITVDDRPAFWS